MAANRLTILSPLYRKYNMKMKEEGGKLMKWPINKKDQEILLGSDLSGGVSFISKTIERKRNSKKNKLYNEIINDEMTREIIKNINYNKLTTKKLEEIKLLLDETKRLENLISRGVEGNYDISKFLNDGSELAKSYFLRILRSSPIHMSDKYALLILDGNKIITLSTKFFNNQKNKEDMELMEAIGVLDIDQGYGNGSDVEFLISNLDSYKNAVLSVKKKTIPGSLPKGGFFAYKINDTIFKKSYVKLREIYNELVNPEVLYDCLKYVIEQSIDNDVIRESIISKYVTFRKLNTGTFLQRNKLQACAKFIDVCFIFHDIENKETYRRSRTKKINPTSKNIVNIINIDDHYSIFKIYDITKKDIVPSSKATKKLNSHQILTLLINNNFLTPFNQIDYMNYALTVQTPKLEMNVNNFECKDILTKGFQYHDEKVDTKKVKSLKKKLEPFLIYFDTETYTNKYKHHKLYQISFSVGNNKKFIRTYDYRNTQSEFGLIKLFLDDVYKIIKAQPEKQIFLIAHNLSYDIQYFLGYTNGLYFSNLLNSSSKSVKRATAYLFDKKIIFQDSMAFISEKLSNFPKMFNLEFHKEIFPYNAMNKKVVTSNCLSLSDAINCLRSSSIKEEEIKEFEELLKNKNFLYNFKNSNETYINILEYSKYYCELDVILLRDGFDIFRNSILEDLKIEVLDYVSTPSLSKASIEKNVKNFNKIPYLSHITREFVNNSCIGGRTMLRFNEKVDLSRDENKISDLDVTSLYPSAFLNLTDIPVSEPKLINSSGDIIFSNINDIYNYYNLEKGTWLFLQVNILVVRKPRGISLLSRKDEDGTRLWKDEPGTYILNHITIEDLFEFQQVDLKVDGGIYFPKSNNDVDLSNFFRSLFEKRAIYKKAKNPLQLVYKLLMNAVHGKMTQNPIDTEIIFKQIYNEESDKKFNHYLENNFNEIIDIHKIKNISKRLDAGCNISRYMINKRKAIKDYMNHCHIASVMYAYSKRIMNKAIYTAEDNDIKIYYTDTDSMFLDKNNVGILASLYEDKYKTKLLGTDELGKFHSDFEVEESKESDTFARGYFLGKKSYIIDIHYEHAKTLEHTIKSIQKFKGIPQSAINVYLKDNNLKNPTYQLGKKLFDGEIVEFDLVKDQVRFAVDKDFRYKHESQFKRVVSF